MKKKLCFLLVLILIPCTLFAKEKISISDLISNIIVALVEKEDTPNTIVRLPRSEIDDKYKWDLTPIYATEEEFLADLDKLYDISSQADLYKGIMDNSKEDLLKVLTWIYDALSLEDKLITYAGLAATIDNTDEEAANRYNLVYQAAVNFEMAYSYIDPELLEAKNVDEFMADDPRFDAYRRGVEQTIRDKEHYLSQEIEELLLKMGTFSGVASSTWRSLVNTEITFDDVFGKPLSAASYSSMITSPDREIRKEAYNNYLSGYDRLKQTFATLYDGVAQKNAFFADIRGYESTLDSSLFENNIDKSVFFNLIDTVHEALPSLHRYYEIRRKALGLDKLALYDIAIPMIDSIKMNFTYEQAVDIVINALQPLGEEYTSIMKKGLTTEQWVDRYPQIGKTNGASSFITYHGNPVIQMNFKGNDIDDIINITHEGGHSMHTKYSQQLPFSQFGYSTFHAEVASTLNEVLLQKYLLDTAQTEKEKAYYIAYQLDRFVSTVFRQTMFAEFEYQCYQLVEQGYTLTTNTIRHIYRNLLETYFGPDVEILELSDLECFRISHFFEHLFYTYMYAVDYSAAASLAEGILYGGEENLEAYIDYLKFGGTMYPIDALKKAGVDMSSSEPIRVALRGFDALLDEFEALQASLN